MKAPKVGEGDLKRKESPIVGADFVSGNPSRYEEFTQLLDDAPGE